MISIYSDADLLHHQNIDDLKVFSAVVEKVQNGVGTFKFTMEATNPFIDSIVKRKSIITVYDDSYLLFKGICIDIDIGFRNTKTFYCKEDPYFLTYTVSRPYEFSGTPAQLFSKFVTEHNANASPEMQFKVGNVTVTDPNDYIVRADSDYLTTWEGIQKKLIDTLGGYLSFRHTTSGTYIDYLSDYTTQNAQEVNFGKNLIDVNQTETSDEIFTVIIPQGAKVDDERINITSVNSGKDYLENPTGIAKYGKITKMVIWDDVTVPDNLKTKAQALLNSAIQQTTEITLRAVDLNNVDKNINAFRMHNYIKVVSKRNGIDDYYLPLKMTINLFKPEQNTIELNIVKKGLTDYQSGQIKTVYETMTKEVGDMAASVTGKLRDEMNQLSQEQVAYTNSLVENAQETTRTMLEDYTKTTDFEEYQEQVSTSFSQTAGQIEMNFNTISTRITEENGEFIKQFEEIDKYIRFVNGNIILGEEGNQLTLKISNNRISFLEGLNEVAYMSNNKLYITDGEIVNSLRIGNYAFLPRDNGSVDFTRVK